MKKINYIVMFMFVAILFSCSDDDKETEFVVDFENLKLSENSAWYGQDKLVDPVDGSWGSKLYKSSFISDGVKFQNDFSISSGGFPFWSGYAYSNMKDAITPGSKNQFSAYSKSGAKGSKTFLVATTKGVINFSSKVNLKGMYITNSTYTYLFMAEGKGSFDEKSYKYTSKDYNKVWIKSLDSDNKTIDSLSFNLATGTDILKDWAWVSLEKLGKVDKLTFSFESTAKNTSGSVTPEYVLVDNITYTK